LMLPLYPDSWGEGSITFKIGKVEKALTKESHEEPEAYGAQKIGLCDLRKTPKGGGPKS